MACRTLYHPRLMDAGAVALVFGPVVLDYVNHLSQAAGLLWFVIQIWESDTFAKICRRFKRRGS